MMNDLALPKMSDAGVRSPGHEGAGVVVKIGENVKNWKVGDRGGVKPLWDTCGSCRLCWGGQETHCRKGVFAGLQCPGKRANCGRSNHILNLRRNISAVHCEPCEIHNEDS